MRHLAVGRQVNCSVSANRALNSICLSDHLGDLTGSRTVSSQHRILHDRHFPVLALKRMLHKVGIVDIVGAHQVIESVHTETQTTHC